MLVIYHMVSYKKIDIFALDRFKAWTKLHDILQQNPNFPVVMDYNFKTDVNRHIMVIKGYMA